MLFRSMNADPLQSLFVFGCSHHRTPLNERERYALDTNQSEGMLQTLSKAPGVIECLVLGTCNRTEIYGLAKSPDIVDELEQSFCRELGIHPESYQKHAFRYNNLDALQHAFDVSTGLDSQMIGETEILGQVKEAYARAKAAQCTGTVLNRLFEKSFQAAKAARSQTGINRGHISIGNVAADLSNRIFGRLQKSRILILGSGEVGASTAQALKNRGMADISVSSRKFENAHKLARSFGGAAIDFQDFGKQLKNFDIIICCTTAHHHILDRTTVRQALLERSEKPFFLLDLAMPRNIDPAVNELESIYLYNLDDLSTIANNNLDQRKQEIAKARKILRAQAWTLWLQLRRRTAIVA